MLQFLKEHLSANMGKAPVLVTFSGDLKPGPYIMTAVDSVGLVVDRVGGTTTGIATPWSSIVTVIPDS